MRMTATLILLLAVSSTNLAADPPDADDDFMITAKTVTEHRLDSCSRSYIALARAYRAVWDAEPRPVPQEVKLPEGNPETAVASLLSWLVNQQQTDGSWSFSRGDYQDQGEVDRPMSATAMSVLTLLGADQTLQSGRYKAAVLKGVNYLISEAKLTGESKVDFSGTDGDICAHAWATMAVVQASRSGQDLALLAIFAQGAAEFIESSQDLATGGWSESLDLPPDTRTTGWQLIALMAANSANFDVTPARVEIAADFFNSVQTEDGAFYGRDGPGKDPLATAMGLLARLNMGRKPDEPAIARGLRYIQERGFIPSDVEYNLVVTLLMCQCGNEDANAWIKRMRTGLSKSQTTDGPDIGSWYQADDASSKSIGRLGHSGLNGLSFLTYYKYWTLVRQPLGRRVFPTE